VERKIKGLLFGGCSFTWGQGLYHYSNLSHLAASSEKCSFNSKGITEAMIRHKNSIRFPRLVANQLNTFEVCKDDVGKLHGNGGSKDETFDFFDYLFNVERKFSYDDFSHIIIQLSNPYRNYFEFELDGLMYKTKILNTHLYNGIDDDDVGGEEFEKYCALNNYTIDDIQELHLKKQYKRLKERVIFYNKKGIEVRIVCWFGDVIFSEKDDNFFNDKVVKLKYKNKEFVTIMSLMQSDGEMVIEDDFKKNKNLIVLDRHPSKLCHQIIANSIINNLTQKDLI
jgi:hypothetical protein